MVNKTILVCSEHSTPPQPNLRYSPDYIFHNNEGLCVYISFCKNNHCTFNLSCLIRLYCILITYNTYNVMRIVHIPYYITLSWNLL